MALPRRLVNICRTRPGSPRSPRSTSLPSKHPSSRPFSWAWSASSSTVPSTTDTRSKSIHSMDNLPASIFEKSRMSLMTVRSESPDRRTISAYSRCSAESFVSSNRLVMPTMPFMGVRISWLILATNSDLSLDASSAASRAAMSSWA